MHTSDDDGYDDLWVHLRAVEGDRYAAWLRCDALGHGPSASALTLGRIGVMDGLRHDWQAYEAELVARKVYTSYPSFGDFQLNFGITLGTAMFGDEGAMFLRRVWRLDRRRGVRLMLAIHDRELSGLPWEMLRIDLGGGESFPVALSLEARGSIVRYLAGAGRPADALTRPGPTRPTVVYASALGVVAAGLPKLNPDERASIEAILAAADVHQSSSHDHDPMAAGDIRARLSRPCGLFVFTGHGLPQPEAGVYVAADPQSNQAVPLRAAELGAWLVQARVRAAVLAACDTASAQSSVSLAETIVGLGVPTVVAMQAPLSDDHAPRFTAKVVEKLLAGATVDLAVRDARIEMGGLGYLAQFGVPVIVGHPGIRLVAPPPRSEQPRPPRGAQLATTTVTGTAPAYGIVALRGDQQDQTPYLLLLPGPPLTIRFAVRSVADRSQLDLSAPFTTDVWAVVEERVLRLLGDEDLGPVSMKVDEFSGPTSTPAGCVLLAYLDALTKVFPGELDHLDINRWLGPLVAEVPRHDPPTVIDARDGTPLAWPVPIAGLVGAELTPAPGRANTQEPWLAYGTKSIGRPDEDDLDGFCLAAALGRTEDMLGLFTATTKALARLRPQDTDRLGFGDLGAVCRTTRRDGTIVTLCVPESFDAVAKRLKPFGSVRRISIGQAHLP